MLELSSKCKEIPFLLDGEKLKLTEFTIGDILRLIQLQKPMIESGVSGVELMNDLSISRVICAVKKQDTGEYLWDHPVETAIGDFKKLNYPKNMLEELVKHTDNLNPISLDSLDTKKKSS